MTTEGFDLGGLDMGALLAQAQAVQSQLQTAQEQLADATFEGSSGGDLVHATVTGTGELVSLDIAPEVIDPSDPETLCDLVVAAVKDATEQAHVMQKSLMPQVPGVSF